MSELNATLSRQLTEVREQLAAIRAKMPDIIKIKSYSANYMEQRTDYQEFGSVASEYRQLLKTEIELAKQVDNLSGVSAAAGGTYTTSFGGL